MLIGVNKSGSGDAEYGGIELLRGLRHFCNANFMKDST